LESLLGGIMNEAGTSSPLRVSAETFNTAAERYYRNTLLKHFVGEALELFSRDLKALMERAAAGAEEEAAALPAMLNGEDPVAFLQAVRDNVLGGKVSQSVVGKLVGLLLLVIRHHCDHNGDRR